ncbi:MAG: hypothetical protein JJT88_09240 [Gammaproteobacteria bacterium]|nr:hypothetical protein [Gammaproteobacteria bacterium]
MRTGAVQRSLTEAPAKPTYNAVILAVPHREFVIEGAQAIRGYGKTEAVLFDVKSALPAAMSDLRL